MISLRPATPDDLSLLTHWDEQPHVVNSDPNDDWDWEQQLSVTSPWREQLVAEWDGQPIGFVQIIDPALEETHYWGEIGPGHRAIDIWIGEAENLGKGYGTSIMKQAIARCFESTEVQTILIDPLVSNTKAHRFYERLGFRFVEQRMFGEDLCRVYSLDRKTFFQDLKNE